MSRADVKVDLLASLLEGEPAADGTPAEEQQMVALAAMLRQAAPPVPPMRTEFRQDLRAQLVQAARDQKAEAPLLTKVRASIQRFKYSTGLAGGVGAASMVLTGGGVAGAAEYAQPGDALYGTKIVLEDARLWLTSDDVAAGTRALAYAQDRLDEAALASANGDDDGAALALRGAADRSRAAEELIIGSGEFEPLLQLFDALASQQAFITGLLPQLSGEAVEAANALLSQVQAGRQNLGRALQDVPGLAIPPVSPDLPVVPGAAPAPSAGSTGVPVEPAPVQPGTPAAPDALPSAPPVVDAPGADAEIPDGSAPGALPPPTVPPLDLPDVPNLQEGARGTEAGAGIADDIIGGAAGAVGDQLQDVVPDDVDHGTDGILGGD